MFKKTKGKHLTYTPTQDLPKLAKLPTEWDMKGLYYTSISDPQLENDIATTERLYKSFVKKYQKSDFTNDAKTLATALRELNKIDQTPSVARPVRYLSLLTALNSHDEAVQKKLNVVSDRLTKVDNTLLFFELELSKIPKTAQKEFLTATELSEYTYYLKQLFETARYNLSEAEERILRLTSNVSYGMWVEMTERMLAKRTIKHKAKEVPVNEAIELVNTLPFAEKPKLWNSIMQELDTLDEVVENELTAVCTKKKISDELRGFKKPYSASVLSHEDDEKSVEALIEAVSTRGFALSKKFYKLKAKLHGVEKLHYAQRNAAIGESPMIDFKQSTEICRDIFYKVNPLYGEAFDKLVLNGHLDVFPKAGKRGGAFMAAAVAQPTNVLLNHVDTLSSLETYAHEMGHAIHSERSKTQPAHYEQYSTTTAETASTLFEGLLFDELFAQADEKLQTFLLHDKLQRDISTIQRQIAFHNFELNMHEFVREHGAISRNELNTMMQNHLKSYLGPTVEVTPLDGNSYVYVSHFRYGFYVYTYTFGTLLSTVMAEEFKADNAYRDKIDTFLTSGGKDTVSNIFKQIGINTKKIDTFNHGLVKLEREIKLLDKLTK